MPFGFLRRRRRAPARNIGPDRSGLPPEFDPHVYRSRHRDLKRFDDAALIDHYERYGRREGRLASDAIPRANFVALLPKDGPVLEIGPFSHPAATGANVRYLDIMDRAGLARRATSIGLPVESIPEIDYVSPSGDLGVVTDKMQAVVSSHCIEHQPDLIKHLQQVEAILADGGHYFVVVPDKRYCFDHYLPESTIAGVLEAHHAGRTVHTLASVIEHRALTTHNDPARHWRGDNGSPLGDLEHIRGAIAEHAAAAGGYIDVHAWQFTPGAFREILRTLHALSLTTLAPLRVYDTPYGSNEFYAVLGRQ
jgi:SAM-dependent methyltransferase